MTRKLALKPAAILSAMVGALAGTLGPSQWPLWAVGLAVAGAALAIAVGLSWVAGEAYELGAREALGHATAAMEADVQAAQAAIRMADDWMRRQVPPAN